MHDLKMSHIGEPHYLASIYIRVGGPPRVPVGYPLLRTGERLEKYILHGSGRTWDRVKKIYTFLSLENDKLINLIIIRKLHTCNK